MEIDKLTLLAGADIPVPLFKANIHQPTIKEIALIGEENFYKYIGLFGITVDIAVKQLAAKMTPVEGTDMEHLVKTALGNISDFELFMQTVTDKTDNESQELLYGVQTILYLLFPDCVSFSFEERFIMGFRKPPQETIIINDEGFKQLKEIIDIIFCLKNVKAEDFNPVDDNAKAIAEKLKKAREKVRTLKGETLQKTYVLANYISCLGVGSESIDLLKALNFTIYQLFDQMERFGLNTQYKHGISAMMAGAKDVELVDWLQGL